MPSAGLFRIDAGLGWIREPNSCLSDCDSLAILDSNDFRLFLGNKKASPFEEALNFAEGICTPTRFPSTTCDVVASTVPPQRHEWLIIGLVAGVVLRYCATQPMTFEMPNSVYAKYALVGV